MTPAHAKIPMKRSAKMPITSPTMSPVFEPFGGGGGGIMYGCMGRR